MSKQHFLVVFVGQDSEVALVWQVPEMPGIKAASGGNVLQPDEEECMHTLGAALHRGLCLKDSYNRGFDTPVSFSTPCILPILPNCLASAFACLGF